MQPGADAEIVGGVWMDPQQGPGQSPGDGFRYGVGGSEN